MEAVELAQALKLSPHPEGGHYREIFRSGEIVNWRGEELAASTAILYLLAKGQISRWHRIPQAEVWHFYGGDALDLAFFDEGTLKLNRAMLDRNHPVAVVPGGCWQAAKPFGRYALMGCTVAPGFEFRYLEMLNATPDKADAFGKTVPGFRDFH
jgi:uncharacterized protein